MEFNRNQYKYKENKPLIHIGSFLYYVFQMASLDALKRTKTNSLNLQSYNSLSSLSTVDYYGVVHIVKSKVNQTRETRVDDECVHQYVTGEALDVYQIINITNGSLHRRR